jgi:hypothetical protein
MKTYIVLYKDHDTGFRTCADNERTAQQAAIRMAHEHNWQDLTDVVIVPAHSVDGNPPPMLQKVTLHLQVSVRENQHAGEHDQRFETFDIQLTPAQVASMGLRPGDKIVYSETHQEPIW